MFQSHILVQGNYQYESMKIFKGRSTMKLYTPMKPIKRGYKIWCLVNQKGYIKIFQIYQGKEEQVSEEFENLVSEKESCSNCQKTSGIKLGAFF